MRVMYCCLYIDTLPPALPIHPFHTQPWPSTPHNPIPSPSMTITQLITSPQPTLNPSLTPPHAHTNTNTGWNPKQIQVCIHTPSEAESAAQFYGILFIDRSHKPGLTDNHISLMAGSVSGGGSPNSPFPYAHPEVELYQPYRHPGDGTLSLEIGERVQPPVGSCIFKDYIY